MAYGAGDGNRTHTTSLEGWGSTIELHPQTTANNAAATVGILPYISLLVNSFPSKIAKILVRCALLGAVRRIKTNGGIGRYTG